jgi:uncharacterized protein YigE (DUF2233 family)
MALQIIRYLLLGFSLFHICAAENIVRIHNSPKLTAYQINPAGHEFKLINNCTVKNSEFGFNTNYYWKQRPVGLIGQNSSFIVPFFESYNYERPIFWIDEQNIPHISPLKIGKFKVACQAGPLLLKSGQLALDLKKDHFKNTSSVAVSNHTVIGITRANKIIVAVFKQSNMHNLAKQMLKLGAVDAMKFDGGHSVYLWHKKKIFGNILKYGIGLFKA